MGILISQIYQLYSVFFYRLSFFVHLLLCSFCSTKTTWNNSRPKMNGQPKDDDDNEKDDDDNNVDGENQDLKSNYAQTWTETFLSSNIVHVYFTSTAIVLWLCVAHRNCVVRCCFVQFSIFVARLPLFCCLNTFLWDETANQWCARRLKGGANTHNKYHLSWNELNCNSIRARHRHRIVIGFRSRRRRRHLLNVSMFATRFVSCSNQWNIDSISECSGHDDVDSLNGIN